MRFLFVLLIAPLLCAHPEHQHYSADPFRQLEEILPTPTETRLASGAPGSKYWQQRADYVIDITLDEVAKTISGSVQIDYYNNSPHALDYLWIQLDRNRFRPESAGHQTREAPNLDDQTYEQFGRLLYEKELDGSYKISSITGADEAPLQHSIVGTMMRLDLPHPLAPGEKTKFKIVYSFTLNDRLKSWARSGYEVFPEDGHALFQVAQFFPRMAAYTDVTGWQNKPFLGRGEFALEFGDYQVSITVPADHIVASTGVLQNPEKVLTETQRERLKTAETAVEPVMIVTPEETATAISGEAATDTSTWIFEAENVRDFAFASSRRFIWDGMQHRIKGSGKPVWAMSYYPPEAEPLWSKYSTHSVAHTLDVYSRLTFDYPYPVCLSVHGKIWGMEYPMITFNGGRPDEDGTYTERLKKALISVIIHEVGHIWFPMIVNSDERQWTWMDEGLNSFLQSVAEEEWSDEPYNVPSLPVDIGSYMKSSHQRPIMTNSESLLQFGNNAYAKPAAALTVLRETVMGREAFDYAFRKYSTRWAFKSPSPADFFRTMEDASGMDLDWFWRGWFYTTLHVDMTIGEVVKYQLDSRDLAAEKQRGRDELEEDKATNLTHQRNADLPKYTSTRPSLEDFYTSYDQFSITEKQQKEHDEELAELTDEERALLASQKHFYTIEIHNKGGLVSPIPLKATTASGKVEEFRIPAEIWKQHTDKIQWLLVLDEELASLEIDPLRETADVDHDNNTYPNQPRVEHFKLKPKEEKPNPIRDSREAEKEKAEEAAKEANEEEE